MSTLITPLALTPFPPATGLESPPTTSKAPPLILLHGFTGDASTFAPLLRHLYRHLPSLPLLCLDLVGHGDSPAPDDPAAYTMSATITSILSTLDLSGLPGPFHLLGYSMGGRIALSLACAHPGRLASLTLLSASPGLASPEDRAARIAADESLADSILESGLPAFVDRWMAHPLFATQSRLGPTHLAAARAQRLRNHPHALAHTLRQLGTGRMPPLWDALPTLPTPTHLIAGTLDPKFTTLARQMSARLPHPTLTLLPDAGHALHQESPAPLAQAIATHLTPLLPPPP